MTAPDPAALAELRRALAGIVREHQLGFAGSVTLLAALLDELMVTGVPAMICKDPRVTVLGE